MEILQSSPEEALYNSSLHVKVGKRILMRKKAIETNYIEAFIRERKKSHFVKFYLFSTSVWVIFY
jgi:hypothetical protein